MEAHSPDWELCGLRGQTRLLPSNQKTKSVAAHRSWGRAGGGGAGMGGAGRAGWAARGGAIAGAELRQGGAGVTRAREPAPCGGRGSGRSPAGRIVRWPKVAPGQRLGWISLL